MDASKGMVEWARKNAALNPLTEKPVRWIVDDVTKFLERELRRGQRYDLLKRQRLPGNDSRVIDNSI